eukprot:3195407-Rhodomonas_salina.2
MAHSARQRGVADHTAHHTPTTHTTTNAANTSHTSPISPIIPHPHRRSQNSATRRGGRVDLYGALAVLLGDGERRCDLLQRRHPPQRLPARSPRSS